MTENITSTAGRSAEERKADPWGFWKSALAGGQPVVGEMPEQGYYRTRNRAGNNFLPVAYWFTADGELHCKVGDKTVDRDTAIRGWPWAQNSPITHEAYKKAMAGEPWPDVDQDALALSNNPPDDENLESMQEAIDKLAATAQKLLARGGAKTQAEADMASQLSDQFSTFEKQADASRRKHKRPHEDAAKAVDADWNPLRDKASDYKKKLKLEVVTPFLRELDAKREAEARAAREREAQAAKTGEPVEAPKPAAKIETKAGAGIGRTVALVETKKGVIEDRKKVLKHFADSEEVTELLQKLCDRAAKANMKVPGMAIVTEKVAR